MSRLLNVGIIQMMLRENVKENLEYIARSIDAMMEGYHRPELVVGVESVLLDEADTIPGKITDFFADIAEKHHIYLIPGSIHEISPELPRGMTYNSAPVFNPQGELVDVYRKMAPWKPAENKTQPGNRYVVFDIPEKQTKVGVQICYDLNFPEISRNEALMGAEVLVKLTMDPEELYRLNKPLHFARAIENQAYMVSTNGVGFAYGTHLYGNSLVISPEGQILWEASAEPSVATVTLDLDVVSRSREYGTLYMDHYMQHLKEFNFPMPYAGDIASSPLGGKLPPAPGSIREYEEQMKKL